MKAIVAIRARTNGSDGLDGLRTVHYYVLDAPDELLGTELAVGVDPNVIESDETVEFTVSLVADHEVVDRVEDALRERAGA
jgi:hypothetical protein